MASKESRLSFESEDKDVVDQFRSTQSLDADSINSVSDQHGLGCTLGNVITPIGRLLENTLGEISERLGWGPDAAMHRSLVVAERAWLRSHHPSFPRLVDSKKFLRRPPRLPQLLADVSALDKRFRWPTPELVQDPKFIGSCRRLISYLRSDKSDNQLLAIYYITALACIDPNILSHLVHLGAPEALCAICSPHSLLSKGRRDRSLLLASSRRALVTFSHSATLHTIKEFNSIFRAGLGDEIFMAVHSGRLLSDLLALSLKPETQGLVARHLNVNTLEIFLVNNYNILQPRLSFRIIANWVTLSLSADPLCSTTFRRLINSLLDYSDVSSTNDAMMYLFACLLQFKIQGGHSAYVDDMLQRVMNTDPLGKGNLSKHPTSETALHPLRQILSQVADSNFSSIDAEAYSILRDILSPFQEIWRDFCSCWYFPGVGNHSLSADSIPLRSISSRPRTELCRRLLALILDGECPTTDVLRIANHDMECHQTIIHLLNNFTATSDTDIDRIAALREIVSSRSAPPSHSLFDDRDLDQWCTGIYRVPSLSKQRQSTSFEVRGGHNHYMPCMSKFDSAVIPSPEFLLGHQSLLRWTPVPEFLAQIQNHNPVRLSGSGHNVDTFIAGIPDLIASTISVFAIADDPEEWTSPRVEPFHILTCCSFSGLLPEVYWYHRAERKLINAFTMEECEAPEWMRSSEIYCPVWECGHWWEQNL
ncbi:hypothetical protein JAAARDRAFT_40860 [Jaapia argillacea MUCL 33604]|uniref:Uncharacterized protein n=1 Tax=Jaapia argillacea MUCL 33604 TaxID=933084 RepID=A0A067PMT5_9AGAM|nr:hypothetical protein JAAARDRAFT_40860 [Jaapia argillacea MUCL 33604]